MANQSLEYGKRQGHNHCNFSFPVGASEVFKKKGGGFVHMDDSGRIEIATATDTDIIGWAILNEDLTASSTEGGTTLVVDMSVDSIFELPINTGTWADTMRGEVCDLSISSSIQGVNLTASSVDVIQVIDKGFTNPAGTVVSVLARRNMRLCVFGGVV